MKFKRKLRRGTNKVIAVILSLATAISLLPIHTETALADPSIIGVDAVYGNGSAGGISGSADGQLSGLQANNIGFRMYLVNNENETIGEVKDFYYGDITGTTDNNTRTRAGNKQASSYMNGSKGKIEPNFNSDGLTRLNSVNAVPYFCELGEPHNTWLAIRGEKSGDYCSFFGNEKDFSDAAICNMVNGNVWIISFIYKWWSEEDTTAMNNYINRGDSIYCFIEPIYQLNIKNYEVSESNGTISTYTLLAGYYDYTDDDEPFKDNSSPLYISITTDYIPSGNEKISFGTKYVNYDALLYKGGNSDINNAIMGQLNKQGISNVHLFEPYDDIDSYLGYAGATNINVTTFSEPSRTVIQKFTSKDIIRGTLYDIATLLQDITKRDDNDYKNIDEKTLRETIMSFIYNTLFGEAANAAYITVPEGDSLCGVAEPTNTTNKPHSLQEIIKYGYGCLAVDLSKLKRYAEEETYEGLYTSTWNENKKVPDRPIGLTRIDNDTNTVTKDDDYPAANNDPQYTIKEVEAASSTNDNTEIHRYKIYDKPQINIHKLYEVYDYNTGKFVKDPVLAGVNIIGAPPNIRIEDEDLDEGLYKVVAYCGGKPKDGESIPSNLSHWNKNKDTAWEYLTANLNKTTEGGGATGKSNSKSGYVDFGDATEVCVRLVRYEGSPDGGGDDDTPDPYKLTK